MFTFVCYLSKIIFYLGKNSFQLPKIQSYLVAENYFAFLVTYFTIRINKFVCNLIKKLSKLYALDVSFKCAYKKKITLFLKTATQSRFKFTIYKTKKSFISLLVKKNLNLKINMYKKMVFNKSIRFLGIQ